MKFFDIDALVQLTVHMTIVLVLVYVLCQRFGARGVVTDAVDWVMTDDELDGGAGVGELRLQPRVLICRQQHHHHLPPLDMST